MNERIERLRNRYVSSERQVDIDRAVIITEAYQEHQDKPPVLRKALALKALFNRLPVVLREDELIVGNHTRFHRGAPLFPEYASKWILDDMELFPTRKGDQFGITEEQKETLRQIMPFWQGRSLRDRVLASLPDFLTEMLDHGVFGNENFTMSGPGHLVPNHPRILKTGLVSVIEDCRTKMDALDTADPFYMDKANLYRACAVTVQALIDWAERYAAEADRQTEWTDNPIRKAELEAVAAICRKVPAHPAETFPEALQAVYFIQIAIQIEANGMSISLGRPDQFLLPYYRADLESGRLTEEAALEWIEAFYLKLSETDKIYSNRATRFLQGPGHGQVFTLGGVDKDGNDATNELSRLFLLADRDIRLVQPDFAVRVHPGTPEDFLTEASINIRAGLTKPKMLNDPVIIESMVDYGCSLEDARDWGCLGCTETVVNGKTDSWGNAGQINLAKCLELALNNGRCMQTGIRMGPETGDPAGFADFDAVLDAFKTQVRYFVKYLVLFDNIIDRCHAEVVPVPLLSTCIDGCLERGIEFNRGGAVYNTSSPVGVGPITAGDSLAAIKTLVFDRKAVSLTDLVDALKADFEGREPLRQMLINRAPKFGNDDDTVDALCNQILRIYCDELRLYTNPRGGPFIGALYYLTANIPFGHRTAASADGRKNGEPLNDGGISPVHGRDRKGATAVAKSVGKLEHVKAPHGCILNQRIHPTVLDGDDKIGLFNSYMRTFMDLGGWHTQMNVVTTETLRAAQAEPDNYRDLVIRVAGYSAYFTQLEEEVQNDIIDRTEQLGF